MGRHASGCTSWKPLECYPMPYALFGVLQQVPRLTVPNRWCGQCEYILTALASQPRSNKVHSLAAELQSLRGAITKDYGQTKENFLHPEFVPISWHLCLPCSNGWKWCRTMTHHPVQHTGFFAVLGRLWQCSCQSKVQALPVHKTPFTRETAKAA